MSLQILDKVSDAQNLQLNLFHFVSFYEQNKIKEGDNYYKKVIEQLNAEQQTKLEKIRKNYISSSGFLHIAPSKKNLREFKLGMIDFKKELLQPFLSRSFYAIEASKQSVFANSTIVARILFYLNRVDQNKICNLCSTFRILIPLIVPEQLKEAKTIHCDTICDMVPVEEWEENVDAFLQQCGSLKRLHLTEDQDIKKILPSLIKYCKQLQEIDLEECPIEIDHFRQILSNFPNLIHLSIKGCRLGDDALQLVYINCPQLQRLNFAGTCITKPCFPDLYLNPLFSLRMIDFSGCSIDDEGLSAFLQRQPSLMGINLAWCEKITNKTLNALVTYQLNLQHLNVEGCSSMGEEGLSKLIEKNSSYI
jgi:hypothetical protein